MSKRRAESVVARSTDISNQNGQWQGDSKLIRDQKNKHEAVATETPSPGGKQKRQNVAGQADGQGFVAKREEARGLRESELARPAIGPWRRLKAVRRPKRESLPRAPQSTPQWRQHALVPPGPSGRLSAPPWNAAAEARGPAEDGIRPPKAQSRCMSLTPPVMRVLFDLIQARCKATHSPTAIRKKPPSSHTRNRRTCTS
jgi:hypothetical protein